MARGVEHEVGKAAHGVEHLAGRTAQQLYRDEVHGLREAVRYGKIAAHEAYKHSDDVAVGLTIAGLIAEGVLAPEALVPTLLFSGSDILGIGSGIKAASGGDWSAAAFDFSSLGLSRLAAREVREAHTFDRLSLKARREYHDIAREIDFRTIRTSGDLRRDIERALGSQRAARLTSEDLRRLALITRVASAVEGAAAGR